MRPKNKKLKEVAEREAKKILDDARNETERHLTEARKQLQQIRHQAQEEESKSLKRIDKLQEQFEERMTKRESILEEKIEKAEVRRDQYEKAMQKYEEKKKELEGELEKQNQKLEEVAKLSQGEAKKELFTRMEQEVDEALSGTLHRRVEVMREAADEEAAQIIVQAIQRYAPTTVAENTTSVVKIESEEIKGKIIGKEGRNINAFEMLTGVDVIIDDSPGTITLSSFDMFRRYVAKVAMETLIKDGRIHPSRIEEALKKAEESADKLILDLGKKACEDLGIVKFPDPILKLLGRLRFRTSYGQNVLAHSIEVAYIAEAIAQELPGTDPEVCKKAGLLHDIGKAVSHEIEGGHTIIGMEILAKFNVDPRVIQAMKSHHEDFPYETIESRILQAADAISAARPGARRDTIEKYLKRLKDIEAIASSFEGIKKVYAIQAGREVRVFVNAKEIDDKKAEKVSFDIARKLEKDCQYPGEIKVTVIRENRFENVAK